MANSRRSVTPCMGVWIETPKKVRLSKYISVTPCMGVWIETRPNFLPYLRRSGHTLYGCVDWNYLLWSMMMLYLGHTLYGCVDWNPPAPPIIEHLKCHTLYGCVDWNTAGDSYHFAHIGHTLYGCVDWNSSISNSKASCTVTPCMGVWIETDRIAYSCCGHSSHPVWVCGLKPAPCLPDKAASCHTLYGCVDWNPRHTAGIWKYISHTLYGCVDWNNF